MKTRNWKLKITNKFITRKFRKIGLVILAGLISAGGLLIWWSNFARPASAAWFDDSWSYRKSIEVTAHTSAESNVYWLTPGVDTTDNTRFASNCSNIRFTDYAGKVLPFFVVASPGCNNSATTFHVFLQNFPAGAQTFYIYYGNTNAPDGRTLTDFATAASGVTNGSVGSEEAETGPISYWRFDEGTGTAANDSTANNNVGTLTGAITALKPTWQSEDLCISAKCLYFEGSGSDVTAATINAIKSVSMWVRYASGSGTIPLIKLTSSADLKITTANTLTSDGLTGAVYYVDGVNTTTITNSSWHHVEVTMTSAVNANALALGLVGTSYLRGFVDEVKLYNYVRTAAQIQQDAIKQNARKGSSAVLGDSTNNDAALSQGLVGYWKMDEPIWTRDCTTLTATDSAGLNNKAKSCPSNTGPTTSPTAANTQAKFGNAGDFDGVTNYLEVPDAASLEPTTLTLSSWVRPTTLGGVVIQKATNAAGTNGYYLDTNSSKIRFCGTGGCASSTTTLTTSVWSHVVVTFSGGTTSFFLNGAADGTSATITSVATNTIVLRMGADSAGATLFTGQLDETRVYNRALSPVEVQTLYNFAPGPVGQWNFEEGSGTTANDTSSNGNTGTWTGTGTNHWVQGKFGFAGNLNGTDDFVTINYNSSLDLASSGTFTSWVKFNSVSASEQNIFGLGGNCSGGCGFEWQLGNAVCSGSAAHLCFNVDGLSTLPSNTNLTAGVWYYVSATWTANSQKIYINGVLDAQGSGAGSPVNNTQLREIGDRLSTQNPGTGRSLNGSVDQVLFYNYDRTPSQIVQDMNAGHPAPGSPVGSAANWWKFEEGYGTVAHDSGTHNDIGTLTNMASLAFIGISGWLPAGKWGRGIAFDGVNDFVDFGDMSHLEGISTMSASFWVNPNVLNTARCLLCKWQQTAAAAKESFAIETGTTNGASAVRVEISKNGNASQAQLETPTGQLAVGSWTHVAVIYDGGQAGTDANALKIYINGIKQTLTVVTSAVPGSLQATTSNLRAGTSSDSTPARLFAGQMDEIKIYLGALTQSQILADMQRSQTTTFGSLGVDTFGGKNASSSASSAYCVPGDTSTCNPPVGEWNFEEGSGTSVNDTSGNANTGTAQVAGRFTSGKLGKAGNFDGVNDFIDVGDLTNSESATTLTWELWVKPTVLATQKCLFCKWQNNAAASKESWAIETGSTNSNAVLVEISTDGNATQATGETPSAVLTVGQWTHVTVVFDGSQTGNANRLKIYINGVIQSLTFGATSVPATTQATTSNARFGASSDGTAARLFNGAIDTARVFTNARSVSQVAYDYNRGFPQSWWKFDECQGTLAHDSVGSVSGTLNINGSATVGDCNTASTAWGDGKTGKYNYSAALSTTSNTDWTTVTSTGTYPISVPVLNNISWGGWFKPTGANANSQGLIDKVNQFRLYTNSSGNAICGIFNGGAYVDSSSVTAPVTLNQWNHIICTYDGTNIKTYVNGVLKNTTANSNGISVSTSNLKVGISNSNNYTGQADDVKVWTYDLTSYQVRTDYNQGSAIRFGPTSGTP